jgi:predicted kinase
MPTRHVKGGEEVKNSMDKVTKPSLFIFMGLPASGKSTLAEAWAQKHHYSYFNSDIVRKQLAGIFKRASKKTQWGEGIYTPQMTRRTYDALLIYAQQELSAGKTVVLDASYKAREERHRLIRLADEVKITPHFILCYCSEKTTRERLRQRAEDNESMSDADWEIFKKQRENLDSLDSLEEKMVVSINTDGSIEELIEQLDYAFEKRPPIIIDK